MKNKLSIAISLAVILSMLLTSLVLADNISNHLDNTVDVAAEIMPLTVGGVNGTTYLYVDPTNGDGKSGCNLTGSTILTVSVSSSAPAVATVSPTSIMFTSCGDMPTVTVHAVAAGSTKITIAQTANTTEGTFDLGGATFLVNVSAATPTNTAPTISIVGVTGGAAYEYGAVPSATCQVIDAEDGNSSFAATLSGVTGPLSGYGLGERTASCSYTDAGLLTASASITYNIVDTTKPTIDAHGDETVEATGPGGAIVNYTSPATHDAVFGAGVATCAPASGTQFPLGDTTVKCDATDGAGNPAVQTSFVVHVVDTTAPTILCGTADGAWHNDNVSISCTASDVVSLLNAADASFSLYTSVAADTEDANASTNSYDVYDAAGNHATAGPISGNKVDKKAPQLSSCEVPDGNWHNTNVTLNCSYTDGGSGAGNLTVALLTSVASGNEDANAAASAGGAQSCDAVGNCAASPADIAGNKVDLKAPTNIAFVGGFSEGGVYYFNFVPPAPSCTATDGGSGFDTCVVSGYDTTVGSHTLTATAKDKVGNTSTAALHYSVSAWAPSGFFQPVDMTTSSTIVWNTVRNGSTVPLKFKLFAGPTELTNTAYIVQPLRAVGVACGTGTADDIELTSTGGTSLRYDTTGGQFIYNWQTPRTAGACYQVTVSFIDGSSLTAYFKLK